MGQRKYIVGGNWKMNTDLATACALAAGVVELVGNIEAVEVVVFPPFPYLLKVGGIVSGSKVTLGAQDLYHEANGAFTGEVSVSMLKDCGCSWVLCGHSERRHVLGETNGLINKKVRAALADKLKVILCVGETKKEREAGQTDVANVAQLQAGLADVSVEDMERVVIAYEPVWAIGTGLTSTPDDAQNAHAVIRATIGELFGSSVASQVRIQYGGSMKPGNAEELLAQADIDGGLIGGAALTAGDFAAIVKAAKA